MNPAMAMALSGVALVFAGMVAYSLAEEVVGTAERLLLWVSAFTLSGGLILLVISPWLAVTG